MATAASLAENRILKETAHSLVLTWYVDGTATDVGTVTIGITDPLGNTVVASGTATTNNADGTYTYSVASSLTGEVDRWTVKWTEDGGEDQTTEVEIVGSWLFTENDARTFHNNAFTDASTYSDAWITAERERITEDFEEICEVSFIDRYGLDRLGGSGAHSLRLTRPKVQRIISASIDGTSQTVANIDVMRETASDRIWHTTSFWSSPTSSNPLNCVVEYAHGYSRVPPPIRRAALIVLRNSVTTDISDRFLSLSTEAGVIRQADPNRPGNWYGIPEVDAVLNRYMHRVPVL